MKRLKIHWDLIVIGIAVGIFVNLSPVDRLIERAFAGTWEGLPWVLLGVFWLGLGGWAYVEHRRRSNGSANQE